MTFTFSERSKPREVGDFSIFEEIVTLILTETEYRKPLIATLADTKIEFTILIDVATSMLQYSNTNKLPPYMVTLGSNKPGAIDCYYMGSHHTEIPRKNLITTQKMKSVIQDFFEAGCISNTVDWEEV